jgi:hypothetical protein
MPKLISASRAQEFRRAFDGQIGDLAALYRNAAADALDVLTRAASTVASRQRALALLRQYETMLAEMNDEAALWIHLNVPEAYDAGVTIAEEGIGNIQRAGINLRPGRRRAVALRERDVFSRVHQEAAQAIAAAMVDRMSAAVLEIGRRVDDVFRQEGMVAVARGIAAGRARVEVSREIKDRLIQAGQPVFRDRLGRIWTLDRYSEMVARTTTREAMTQGTINRLRQEDILLARVSSHPCEDFCCAPGTRVLTSAGWHRIETIQEGDLVMTHQGRWRAVTTVMRRHYKGPLIEIGGLRVTPDHRVLTRRGWMKAGALLGRDQIVLLKAVEDRGRQCAGVFARCNAEDLIAQGAEVGIPNTISLSAPLGLVPAAAVDLNDQISPGEEEISHIRLDGLLEDIGDAATVEFGYHRTLDRGWISAVGRRVARGPSASGDRIPREISRAQSSACLGMPSATIRMVGISEALGGKASGWLGLDAIARQPSPGQVGIVGAAAAQFLRDVSKIGSFCDAAAEKLLQWLSEAIAELLFGPAHPQLAEALGGTCLGATAGFDKGGKRIGSLAAHRADGLHARSIDGSGSSRNNYRGPVWNLSVAGDESYVAEGIVVHNCIYFEGMIVNIGSKPHPVYPDISAIGGGPPFHPQCTHVLEPFVERLASREERQQGKAAPKVLIPAGRSREQQFGLLQRRFTKQFPDRAREEGKRLRTEGARAQARQERAAARAR